MNLEGKKIAILGGGRISCEIVKAAHNNGMHTTVLDYNTPDKSPAKLISDSHALISVADTDCVAEFVKNNGIDGIITGYTDSILGWYADACEKAGLPCYGTRKQFEIFSDKRKWKKACMDHGVPTGEVYYASTIEDALDIVKYPVFAKPSDGSGARGTSVAHCASELKQSWALAEKYSKNGDVLLEEYLEGPEVTVFWLFIDGRYHVNLLGNRHVKANQDGVIPLPAGYTFPSAVLPRYLDEVAPCVRSMLEAEKVRNGMMFMQCIVRDGLPYVYDIGYRLTGSLEHYLTKAVAGYSAMDMLLHYAVTGRMTDDAEIEAKIKTGLFSPCYNVSCLMCPGTVGRFEGLSSLDNDPNVIAYVKAHVEGETLPPEAKGQLRQIALRILGKVDSVDDLKSIMLRLQGTVSILTPEGDNLMLSGLTPTDFEGVLLR